MDQHFSPTLGVLRGQQVEQGLAQAQLEGMSLAERLALKKAAGQLGSQNYFAGYEGVPGAERPAALQEGWQGGDPSEMAKLEALYSEPFKLNRQAEQAGKVKAAEKDATLDFQNKLMQNYFRLKDERNQRAREQGHGSNAFGAQMTPGSGVLAPGQSMAAAPTNLSATKETFSVTPQGITYGDETMSDFEQSMKMSERTARESATELAGKKFTQDQLNQAHMEVRDTAATLKQARDQYMQTGQGRPELEAAQQDYLASRRALDARLQGTTGAGVSPQQATLAAPSIVGSNTLSPMKQQEVVKKNLEEQNTAINKEVVNIRERGKGQAVVRSVIDSLREQYAKLNDMGGITNTEKGMAQNIVPGVAATTPGQLTGKLLGTKAQSLRNTIAQQRPLLMQAIMKATGMTAKQMDSNVELKLWLSTATDPTLDLQSNMKSLDMLQQLYGQELDTTNTTPQTGVAPFHDPEKERRYQEFKKSHK
jgi:hypothetical protein